MSKRLVRVQGFWAKIEGTEGTDSVPTNSANAIRVAGPLTLELGAEVENSRADAISETLGILQPLPPSAKYAELTIPWHVRGFGAAYSASNLPEADPLFQACGMSQTVVTTGGSETVTYAPLAATQKASSIYFYEDGVRHRMLGCRGDWTLAANAGQPGLFNFKVRGVYVAATDTAFSAGTYATVVPPRFTAASSLSYNSVSTLVVRSFNAAIGNSVTARLSANATDGLAGYHISNRASSASFTCEAPLVATADFEADWAAATARVLDTVIGATQYNLMQIHVDKFTPTKIAYADSDGYRLSTVSGTVSTEGTEVLSLIFA